MPEVLKTIRTNQCNVVEYAQLLSDGNIKFVYPEDDQCSDVVYPKEELGERAYAVHLKEIINGEATELPIQYKDVVESYLATHEEKEAFMQGFKDYKSNEYENTAKYAKQERDAYMLGYNLGNLTRQYCLYGG